MYASFNARALGLVLSARESIDMAARCGFEGVDLLVRDVIEAGDDPAELRRRMDGLGLRGGAWPLPVDWRGEPGPFRRDLQRLPRYAEAAAALGLARTGTWVMPATSMPHDLAVTFHLERLGAIARVLNEHDTRLGLEVIGVESFREGRGQPFVARMADLDAVLGSIWAEAPNLGVLVDAFHLHAAAEPIDSALAWGVDRVVWVHIADLPAGSDPDRAVVRDGVRGLPGDHGAVDARGLLHHLAQLGYDGPVTAEPLADWRRRSGLDAESAAREAIRSLRAIWPSDVPS